MHCSAPPAVDHASPLGDQENVTAGTVPCQHGGLGWLVSSNKCHATRNRCLTSSNKKLLETSASLLVTRFGLDLQVRGLFPPNQHQSKVKNYMGNTLGSIFHDISMIGICFEAICCL